MYGEWDNEPCGCGVHGQGLVKGRHIPESTYSTSSFCGGLPRVSGAKAALTLGYFYDAATRHAPLKATPSMATSFRQ
jgi:hypothetical protein